MLPPISSESLLWFTSVAIPDLWQCPTWLVLVVLLFLAVNFLKVFSAPEKPEITTRCTGERPQGEDAAAVASDKKEPSRIQEVIQNCAILHQVYDPPALWGRNGHIQTAVYGLLGHASLRRQFDKRHAVKLTADGTTVTFDVFEPINPHSSGRDYTLALCPGIANSSESNYIRTCVHYAQERGYRCAVLNHLGALNDVQLTSNHIFSYGGTDELEAMMNRLMAVYPNTRFVNIGFSMGGNITTRLISKMHPQMRSRVVFGLSVGQGYCASTSAPMYHDWENGRRVYNYIITENMKRLLRRNYDMAVGPHVRAGLIDEERLWAATSIIALDENYNRRVQGFENLDYFYKWCSSLPLIPDISVPMLFLNAKDDPIVPPRLWEPVRKAAEENPHIAFVLTKHGGHLGFLEGTSLYPKSVTWLDRLVCDVADAAVATYDDQPEQTNTQHEH